MKKYWVLLFAVLGITGIAYKQTKTTTPQNNDDEPILFI